MDQTVNPCDDFYEFTCGNWESQHPRPDSSASYDWFAERQKLILRNIREFLSATNDTNVDNLPKPVRQTQMMYQACMNIDRLDELGFGPVVKYLEEYRLPMIPLYLNLTDRDKNRLNFDWIRSIGIVKKAFGGDLLIGFDVFPDPKNRSNNRIALGSPEPSSMLPL